ncbi:hypothetical protein EVAR_13064_1 [Eumeta japonica]|uniref:Uncharacterized protein n=1 Tax=Eumeta variegata TaxID=151549 RepID=A0A4C1VJD2_EUMVA|nr:hypothetical protein EVAR_13064_1 [Eumeta japonica]
MKPQIDFIFLKSRDGNEIEYGKEKATRIKKQGRRREERGQTKGEERVNEKEHIGGANEQAIHQKVDDQRHPRTLAFLEGSPSELLPS